MLPILSDQPACVAPAQPPQLAVVVVVDQMRGDELASLREHWQHGLRKVTTEGHVWTQAYHSHGHTETASGHATVATGLVPATHGVLGRDVWVGPRTTASRGGLRGVNELAGPGKESGAAGRALLAPTLGDRLMAANANSRVVAVAAKARSANMMGGRGAGLVAWFDDETPTRVVGRYSGQALLPDWLQAFRPNPEPQKLSWALPATWAQGAPWPPSRFDGRSIGLSPGFPHAVLPDASAKLQMKAWNATPNSDRAVVELALLASRELSLGTRGATDLLFVSLAATDVVGHTYGPFTAERAAVLMGVDEALGGLLRGLLQRVPRERLLVTLTADHGVMPTVAQAKESGKRSGTLSMADVEHLAERAVRPHTRAPDAVVVSYPFVFLRHPDPRQRDAMARSVRTALAAHPSIKWAWTAKQLVDDPCFEAALMRNSWTPDRGGDVIFVPHPFHKPVFVGEEDEAAEHATPWAYDRHVPLLWWGQDVVAKSDDAPTAVTEVIAKLAHRLGLAPPSRQTGAGPQVPTLPR